MDKIDCVRCKQLGGYIRPGKYLEGGKRYCGYHAPSVMAKRKENIKKNWGNQYGGASTTKVCPRCGGSGRVKRYDS